MIRWWWTSIVWAAIMSSSKSSSMSIISNNVADSRITLVGRLMIYFKVKVSIRWSIKTDLLESMSVISILMSTSQISLSNKGMTFDSDSSKLFNTFTWWSNNRTFNIYVCSQIFTFTHFCSNTSWDGISKSLILKWFLKYIATPPPLNSWSALAID